MKLSVMGGVYFAILFSIVPPPVWAKEKAYARTYSKRDSTLRGLAETVENNFGLVAELEATFVEAGKKGYKGKVNTGKKSGAPTGSPDKGAPTSSPEKSVPTGGPTKGGAYFQS